MPEQEQKKNYLELVDISKNSVAGTAPLDQIKHMPRVGERIFLPVSRPDGWTAYRIVDIEYFLSTNEGHIDDPGTLRVTVYVEPSE
jgi:hypothetical protein